MAGGAHVLQNMAAHAAVAASRLPSALKNTRIGKRLHSKIPAQVLRTADSAANVVPDYLLARSVGLSGMGQGNAGSVRRGFGRFLVPEYGIIGDEAAHAGHKIQAQMASRNVDGKLSRRNIVNIRRALGGDFSKLYVNKKNREDLLTIIESINPEVGRNARLMAMQAQNNPAAEAKFVAFLDDLGTTWRRNQFFGTAGVGIKNRMTADRLRTLQNAQKANAGAEYGTEIMANAAAAVSEPFVTGFNASKRFMASSLPARWAAKADSVDNAALRYAMKIPKKLLTGATVYSLQIHSKINSGMGWLKGIMLLTAE